MNFDNGFTFYSEESTLEEQLNIFQYNLHNDIKDITLDQLLSAPIPTYYPSPPTYYLSPTHYGYVPSSPTSSMSSSTHHSSEEEEEESIPEIEIKKVPTNNNNKKKSHNRKILPPGQCTLPIRVAINKPVRPPRHLECYNCKVTKTPLWRRTPDRLQTLCNACGLYYKQYSQHRPLHIRPTLKSPMITPNTKWNNIINKEPVVIEEQKPVIRIPQQIEEEESNIECINCQQTKTPLWRKNNQGEPLCNACGLYYKLHQYNRPITMRKSTIQRRRRIRRDDEYLQQQLNNEENWVYTNM